MPPLVEHFLAASAQRLNRAPCELTDDALDLLANYHWPGNVRELQNVIERAVILSTDGVIAAEHITLNRILTPRVAAGPSAPDDTIEAPASESGEVVPPTLADAERAAIIRALRQAEGRVSGPAGAAAILGLKPTTLHAKMKKLGVRRRDALLG